MKKQKGFTLIELLVCYAAIIVIIAAIAIPPLYDGNYEAFEPCVKEKNALELSETKVNEIKYEVCLDNWND